MQKSKSERLWRKKLWTPERGYVGLFKCHLSRLIWVGSIPWFWICHKFVYFAPILSVSSKVIWTTLLYPAQLPLAAFMNLCSGRELRKMPRLTDLTSVSFWLYSWISWAWVSKLKDQTIEITLWWWGRTRSIDVTSKSFNRRTRLDRVQFCTRGGSYSCHKELQFSITEWIKSPTIVRKMIGFLRNSHILSESSRIMIV